MTVVTAAQILRSIAESDDPDDEADRRLPHEARFSGRPSYAALNLHLWKHRTDPFEGLPNSARIGAGQLAQRLGVTKRSVYRGVEENRVPVQRRANHRQGYLFLVGDLREAMGLSTGTACSAVPTSAGSGADG